MQFSPEPQDALTTYDYINTPPLVREASGGAA